MKKEIPIAIFDISYLVSMRDNEGNVRWLQNTRESIADFLLEKINKLRPSKSIFWVSL